MSLATQHIVDDCFAEAARTLAMTNVQLVEITLAPECAPFFSQLGPFVESAQMLEEAYDAIGWSATNFTFSAKLGDNGRDVLPCISFVISPDPPHRSGLQQPQRQSSRRRRHTLGQVTELAEFGSTRTLQRPVAQGS